MTHHSSNRMLLRARVHTGAMYSAGSARQAGKHTVRLAHPDSKLNRQGVEIVPMMRDEVIGGVRRPLPESARRTHWQAVGSRLLVGMIALIFFSSIGFTFWIGLGGPTWLP